MRPGWYWATNLGNSCREIVCVQLTHTGDDIEVFRAGSEYVYRADEFIFHRRVEE